MIDEYGHDSALPDCMSYFGANRTFNVYTRDNNLVDTYTIRIYGTANDI